MLYQSDCEEIGTGSVHVAPFQVLLQVYERCSSCVCVLNSIANVGTEAAMSDPSQLALWPATLFTQTYIVSLLSDAGVGEN